MFESGAQLARFMPFNTEFGFRLCSEEEHVGFDTILTMGIILLRLRQILHQRHPSLIQNPLRGKL